MTRQSSDLHMVQYLNPATLSMLGSLDLVARRVVEGFITGLHSSPWRGFNVEFAEHRAYLPGDDLRHIDWKVLARQDRFYVKRFEADTNLRAYLALDCSASMLFDPALVSGQSAPVKRAGESGAQQPPRLTRLRYGQMLAACLAWLLLRQRDSVGLACFNDELRGWIPSRGRAGHLKAILEELEKPHEGRQTSLAACLDELAGRLARRSLIILISDLLDDVEETTRRLSYLLHRGHEVIVFHLVDQQELNLELDGLYRFVDLENGAVVSADTARVRADYLRIMGSFLSGVEKRCQQLGVDYCRLSTDDPLELGLGNYLAERMARR